MPSGLKPADTGGPVHELLEVGLPLGETRAIADRQPARRAEGLGRRLRRQAVLLQLGARRPRRSGCVRPGSQLAGNLLAADLEQQLAIHLRRLADGDRAPLAVCST